MTTHTVLETNANNLLGVQDKSVALVVTSPPYPMIEMWNECFFSQDESIRTAYDEKQWKTVFEKMHSILNSIWDECDRVLIDNGFICVNIGDATKNCDGMFQLFSNHSKIIEYFFAKGYCVLPDIIWRKQSNSPNKFMGSGMFPAGAYVTYEHEYILIFRKGGKREFTQIDEKENRKRSAYFWEERNLWFSDLWDIKGVTQKLNVKNSRERSAAFPLEVPHRLVNMYSVKGDTVLDPFAGIGTTALACMASERNSISVEVDSGLAKFCVERLIENKYPLNEFIQKRVDLHTDFISNLPKEKYEKCYQNKHQPFKVKTKHEVDINMLYLKDVSKQGEMRVVCTYRKPKVRLLRK